ncbi:MAG TPA: UDP-N-acetylmuramoyl-tripeptide--D-alanyl-D-alanine ligase [Vicinamibacteria bacterium]|nr:UDP-N-acetylmuramoyl-tripeptide--D-alanyl-D-alanine ligase [Vicinamibacteria bacterium]
MTPVALREALTLADVLAGAGGTLATPVAGEVAFTGVSIDSRTIPPGALFVAIQGPKFDGHDFLAEAAGRGARAALVHRDVPAPAGLPLVRVADTTQGLADLARRVRREAAIPVVAVTGSVGKTTTKDMTAHLLATRGPVLKTEGNLNNQYGLPLTLLRLKPEHTAAVLELGMSAPGEIRALSALAEPDVATITRIAPVHLEFFASVDAIAEAKAEILEGLRPGGTAVLNGDDPRLRAIGERFSGRVVWFGRDRRFEVSAENERGIALTFDLRVAGRSVDVALPLVGAHFVTSFLAAAAAAHVLGVPLEAMADAASSLRPARHRGEVRRLGERVVLLDDCYNSSPEALEAAVVALSLLPADRRVVVLGDMLELGPTGPALHRERGRALAGRVDVVVGVGPLAAEIVEGARDAGIPAGSLHHFLSTPDAVRALDGLVRAGDAVLVKASRGVRLEAVVDALAARFGEGQA